MPDPAQPTGNEAPRGELRLDEPAPGVARLTIHNPAKRGALDHAILSAFVETLPRLDHRCLIITGSERIFSAGYDLVSAGAELTAASEQQFADEAERLIAHPFTAAIDAVDAFPYPTIASLNGHAIGGGLELAISCDLRIAAAHVKLGMPPGRLGLVYSHTGLRKFIETVGAARTRDLFLTARRIDATAGETWGLINAVAEADALEATTLQWAADVVANAPVSQRGNKRMINALLASSGALEPALEAELVELRRACFSSDDFREGVTAFVEKRAPKWQGTL